MSCRVSLLRVDEAGEKHRIANEENGRVVSDQIPIALLRIELHREAARIARRVRTAALAA